MAHNNILFNNFLSKQYLNDKIFVHDLKNKINNIDSSFNLINMNIRSINKHITDLSCLIKVIGNHVHIISLSEAWLNKHFDKKFVFLNNYQIIHINNNINKSDGVVLFIRNDCIFTYKEVIFSEANCLITNTKINEHNYCIVSLYRSPMVMETYF